MVKMRAKQDSYADMTKWVQEHEIEMMPDLASLSPHDIVYCRVPAVTKSGRFIVDSKRKSIIPVPWTEGASQSKHALEKLVASGVQDIRDLKKAMEEYSNTTPGDISAVLEFLNRLETDEEKWENQLLIWKIAKLALRAEQLIEWPLRSLRCPPSISSTSSITLSQEQCACILANAFFSTFNHREHFNDINMHHLFSIENRTALTKLKFIFHYFKCVTDNMPKGCVSFSRHRIVGKDQPDWKSLDGKIHKLAISDANNIEDCHNFLQMDFASKLIGGGVLKAGAFMEEIRFLICPEMMVSMLLCPVMKDDEAIFIAGAQRFSSYEGYAKSLKWKPFADYGGEPRDKYGRVLCELVAIDARHFSKKSSQFSELSITRELNKAHVGFHSKLQHSRPIATGNWGCGAFNGNRELKSLIQLMAASQAGRDMVYVPYDSNQSRFGSDLNRIYRRLVQREVTIGELYRILVSYSPTENISVFDYVTREIS